MPIDSSIYGQLDTQMPLRIAASLDPMNEYERQAKLADLLFKQQMQPLQLQALHQQVGEAARKNAMEASFRTDLAGLGSQATQDDIARVSAKYAPASDILQTYQKSLDRKAAQEQHVRDLILQHENRVNEIKARATSEGELRRDLQANAQEFQRQMRQMMLENRQPQAPVVAQDPSDPSQSIYVTPGQAYGMRPPNKNADDKALKISRGADALNDQLDTMRDIYKQLNEKKGIPSTQRGPVSNIGSSLAASGVGQFLGGVVGTDEQSLRNQIKNSRQLLLQGIKNATGMSAQELNSNMELQTWLSAITDPTKDYESNVKVMDNIERFVALRSGRNPPNKPPTAPTAPAVPTTGGKTMSGFKVLGREP